MTNHNFLDVHILHAIPFSNLNRDNLGTPKQMVYGDTTRSRISSQCTKRAARLWLEDNTDLGSALRTRRLPQALYDELVATHGFEDDDAFKATEVVFHLAGIKITKEGEIDEETGERKGVQGDQLTFTTTEAARSLAAAVQKHREAILGDVFKPDRAAKAEILNPLQNHNPIIALCGRMLAALPDTNIDGALQVGHAFTTHTSSLELDYFTAVDDSVQEDDTETGAGHINVNEFTSGVFYRHASIGMGQLAELLDHSASTVAEVAGAFIRAFMLAEPTGKQNAANAHTRPALVSVTLRSDRPVSYASAFEKAVYAPPAGGGYMAGSITQLGKHAEGEAELYGTDSLLGMWHAVNAAVHEGDVNGLGDRCRTFDALVAEVASAIGEHTS